ncbi:MAG: hypothetical protein MUC43_15380 [Pirellula sp.]|nr:hypothetical protein [Pirellula sp.]
MVSYLQVDGEYINDKHALVTASINRTKLDPVSFNTTGASTHLNQSLFTRGIYAAPGKIAPNYRGAIGVSDSGVAGVDVTVPAFEFSVRKKFEFVSTDYLLAMVAMTGRVNSKPRSIFAPGEALFLGGHDEQNCDNVTCMHFRQLRKPLEGIKPLRAKRRTTICSPLQKAIERHCIVDSFLDSLSIFAIRIKFQLQKGQLKLSAQKQTGSSQVSIQKIL